MPKKDLNKSNDNLVKISFWKPLHWLSVGHVSLQTYKGGKDGKGIYASVYPKSKDIRYFSSYDSLNATKEEDCFPLENASKERNVMGREPDNEVCLYSLDVDAINEAYKEFLASGCKWDLLAGVKEGFSNEEDKEKISNCVLLVRYLLEKGGIKNLIGGSYNKRISTALGIYLVLVVYILSKWNFSDLYHSFLIKVAAAIDFLESRLMSFGVGLAVATEVNNYLTLSQLLKSIVVGRVDPRLMLLGAKLLIATEAKLYLALSGFHSAMGSAMFKISLILPLCGVITDLVSPTQVNALVEKAQQAEESRYNYVKPRLI